MLTSHMSPFDLVMVTDRVAPSDGIPQPPSVVRGQLDRHEEGSGVEPRGVGLGAVAVHRVPQWCEEVGLLRPLTWSVPRALQPPPPPSSRAM